MADTEEREFSALPKPEAQEEQEPRVRRNFGDPLGIFVLLVLAAAVGGLIAVYWPWITNGADSSEMNDRVGALETRIGQIAAGQAPKAAASAFQAERSDLAALKMRVDADEARLDSLEKNGNVPPDLPARLDADEKTLARLNTATNARIAALEKNVPPDLPQRLNAYSAKADLAALDARVAKLESRDTTVAMKHAAAVLALAELVRVSETDASFESELAALRALSSAPELAALSHYAKGVPTEAMLAERFPNTADAILAAERRSNAKSWVPRLWASFENLVSVRRIGNVKGDSTEAHVARAEFDLNAGNLEGAAHELGALKGPARNAAAQWISGAKARLAVTRDTRALTNRIVSDLAHPQ